MRGSTSSLDLADFDGLPPRGIYRFVRLQTDPEEQKSGAPYAGPDIDAVGAISSCDAVTLDDSDGDGVVDTVDTTGTAGSADFDDDGLIDAVDACPFNPDVAVKDPDSDGVDCGGTSGNPGGAYDSDETIGCGCTSAESAPGAIGLVLLGLLVLRRRRR